VPRDVGILFDEFQRTVRSLDQVRRHVEELFTNGSLNRREIELFYESLFINLVRSFENMIERAFLGLMAGTLRSRNARVRPLVKAASVPSARRIVQGGKPYLDWLPYNSYTVKRAKAFFSRGLPFERLAQPLTGHLEQVSITRNAIAHQSAHALRRFEGEVIGGVNLPPRERTPAGFLRSVYAWDPRHTRFEVLAHYAVEAGACILK